MPNVIITIYIILLGTIGCNQDPNFNYEVEGLASYYHDALEGNLTANGDVFSQDSLTAAHRTLPFGTKVLVTYAKNNKAVWVVINDRGPFNYKRIIDLSKSAADSLGMVHIGIGKVIIRAEVPKEYLKNKD